MTGVNAAIRQIHLIVMRSSAFLGEMPKSLQEYDLRGLKSMNLCGYAPLTNFLSWAIAVSYMPYPFVKIEKRILLSPPWIAKNGTAVCIDRIFYGPRSRYIREKNSVGC